MQLTIVRHGEAEAYLSHAQDPTRRLSPKGEADIQALGRNWQQSLPDVCLASPYQRTQQTASLLKQALGFKTITTCEHLTPEANIELLLAMLLKQQGQHILLVSHQPLVSRLLALLVAGHSRYALDYPMQPGSCASLNIEVLAAGLASLNSLRHAPYDKG